ncbi:hypothetical protein SAMN03159444_01899 [Pseudomonas sp. NFACC02]|uniref:hypothetical protein n=1 Tax=Pseudomonas sp. NFACC02 TaxID=1566250 RepID=UPI0008D2B8DA|nr:hypothetical protein [Pseudomonas sp. NFACC02]SEQ54306.1 hypothetical protein SAMN03159444_01899 [Pseudomonas sp. NFACC02]
MSNGKWWEKTVEYKFVADAAVNGLMDFVAPLSGRHERTAGDAVFGVDAKLVLVEFKATFADVASEETLFEAYGEAQEALQHYTHHFVVYGTLCSGEVPDLELIAERYFVRETEQPALELLGRGVSKQIFDQYLEALSQFKEEDGRAKGKGHVSPAAMSTVIGVSNGRVVGVMSLHDYAPSLAPAPTLSQVPTPTYRPRGPGG